MLDLFFLLLTPPCCPSSATPTGVGSLPPLPHHPRLRPTCVPPLSTSLKLLSFFLASDKCHIYPEYTATSAIPASKAPAILRNSLAGVLHHLAKTQSVAATPAIVMTKFKNKH